MHTSNACSTSRLVRRCSSPSVTCSYWAAPWLHFHVTAMQGAGFTHIWLPPPSQSVSPEVSRSSTGRPATAAAVTRKTHSGCLARDSTGPASEQTTAVAAHPVDATAAAAVLHQKASAAACLLVPHALRQVAQGSGHLSVCIITMFVLCAAAGLHAGPAVQPELCVWQ